VVGASVNCESYVVEGSVLIGSVGRVVVVGAVGRGESGMYTYDAEKRTSCAAIVSHVLS
jgi:hypothetical protein